MGLCDMSEAYIHIAHLGLEHQEMRLYPFDSLMVEANHLFWWCQVDRLVKMIVCCLHATVIFPFVITNV